MSNLSTNLTYTHPSFGGVALSFVGYKETANEDTEWSGYYDVDESTAIVIMVGDDRRHEVDADELVELPEDGYCPGCGQIGCGHYR